MRKFVYTAFFAGVALLAQADNIGHKRHLIKHTQPLEMREESPDRFFTNKEGHALKLTGEEEGFTFVVYGDRTGGPVEGVSILADAVHDTNLIQPDLVMTVGDLVNGYNATPLWMEQMKEFKGIMDNLLCPWYPVAGNHDIYYRGGKVPPGEHEKDYSENFGPLWYAFMHKNCMFIVLFSDEGDPRTGEHTFHKPSAQRMSDAQFIWLQEMLKKGKDADHIFLFLHHPRWYGGAYGDDWDKVHRALVDAGNVSAVFAGHIHKMQYEAKDGIEYITLASVGAGQSGFVPKAGFLHQYDLVNVRKDQFAITCIPVGAAIDPRELTRQVSNDSAELATAKLHTGKALDVGESGAFDGTVTASFTNPAHKEVEAVFTARSRDSRWMVAQDSVTKKIAAGETAKVSFDVVRQGDSIDDAFRPLQVALAMDYIAPPYRYPVPEIVTPVRIDFSRIKFPEHDMVLSTNGGKGAIKVSSKVADLPDGPFTLEGWFNANDFAERAGLFTKAQASDYGIFVSGGQPSFIAHLGGSYRSAKTDTVTLEKHHWYHVAGVYDGSEVRLYIDGKLSGSKKGKGARKTNDLPLMIGADVDADGGMDSPFDGEIDNVRLSKTARYSGDFTPAKKFTPDADTVLLLSMDKSLGGWVIDEDGSNEYVTIAGDAKLVAAP